MLQMKQTIEKLEDTYTGPKNDTNEPVVFFADLTQNRTSTRGSPILFDLNEKRTTPNVKFHDGVFTAQTAGYYFFSFSIMQSEYIPGLPTFTSSYLQKSDEDQYCSVTTNYSENNHTLGCSAIITMEVGEDVYIKFGGGQMFSNINSMFSGIKLFST